MGKVGLSLVYIRIVMDVGGVPLAAAKDHWYPFFLIQSLLVVQ